MKILLHLNDAVPEALNIASKWCEFLMYGSSDKLLEVLQ